MCGLDPRAPHYLLGLQDAPPPSGPRPEDYPEMAEAFRAWKVQNWEQVVELSLAHIGVVEPSRDAPAGQCGWTLQYESAAVYVCYDPGARQVVVESPVVWIAQHQRVPLMRTLLELNATNEGATRFALRGPIVILRYADYVENVSPPKLVAAVREVAILADEHDNWLAEAFGARMVGPEAMAHDLDWKYIGRPMVLAGFSQVDLAGYARKPQADDQLSDWIERALSIVDEHDPEMTTPLSGAVMRALLFIARALCRSAAPARLSTILHWGQDLWSCEAGEESPAAELVQRIRALDRVRSELAHHAPLPTCELEALPCDHQAYVRARLDHLRTLPREKELQTIIVIAAACELCLRSDLSNASAAQLRAAASTGQLERTYQLLVNLLG